MYTQLQKKRTTCEYLPLSFSIYDIYFHTTKMQKMSLRLTQARSSILRRVVYGRIILTLSYRKLSYTIIVEQFEI